MPSVLFKGPGVLTSDLIRLVVMRGHSSRNSFVRNYEKFADTLSSIVDLALCAPPILATLKTTLYAAAMFSLQAQDGRNIPAKMHAPVHSACFYPRNLELNLEL